jgi:hypothetical protein
MGTAPETRRGPDNAETRARHEDGPGAFVGRHAGRMAVESGSGAAFTPDG